MKNRAGFPALFSVFCSIGKPRVSAELFSVYNHIPAFIEIQGISSQILWNTDGKSRVGLADIT